MSKSIPSKSFGYQPEINGLRGLAVICVIANHIAPSVFPGGFIGVDIFFLISGYVITLSLHKHGRSPFFVFIKDFYGRRIKRIIPALIFYVFTAGIIASLFVSDPRTYLKTGFFSLFGASNLYLIKISSDYFGPQSSMNPFTQTWSLGVEEQFYLIFPIFLWLLAVGTAQFKKKIALIVLATVSIISYTYFFIQSDVNPTYAYYSPLTRSWELLLGAIIFLSKANIGTYSSRLNFHNIFLISILASLFIPKSHLLLAVTIAAFSTALLLSADLNKTYVWSLLLFRPLQFTGTISYSLYLWHWGVIVLAKWTIGDSPFCSLIQILLMISLGYSSYRLFEDKRAAIQTLSPTGAKIIYPLSFIVTIISTFSLWRQNFLYLGRGKNTSAYTILSDSRFKVSVNRQTTFNQLISDCHLTPQFLPSSGAPRHNAKIFLDSCISTSSDSPRIYLIGDSFAQITGPLLLKIAQDFDMELVPIIGYGCPFPFPNSSVSSAAKANCPNFNTRYLHNKLTSVVKDGDIVIVRLYLEKSEYISHSTRTPITLNPYLGALAELSSLISKKNASLVLIGSNPTLTDRQLLDADPQWFQKLQTSGKSFFQPSMPESHLYSILDSSLADHSKRHGYHYLSTQKYLCNSTKSCSLQKNSIPLYSDTSHLSEYALSLFYDELKSKIAASVNAK